MTMQEEAPAIGSVWTGRDEPYRYTFVVFMVAGGQVYLRYRELRDSTRSVPAENFRRLYLPEGGAS